MPNIIKPTVGRKVWYRPSEFDQQGPVSMTTSKGQPLEATIIAVWGDRCINVLVTDMVGKQFPVLSCTLLQEGDLLPTDADGNVLGRYCEWMPYQAQQAAKDAAASTPAPEVETKAYADGTEATGTAPLPEESPAA